MNPIRIAIVDDDPAILAALSRLVRSIGHIAASFADADAFMATLDATPPDCVVTDMQMPGRSGLDLLHMLKRVKPDLAVIVMTAHPSAYDRKLVLASGAFAYMSKPFEADELEHHLRELFGDA